MKKRFEEEKDGQIIQANVSSYEIRNIQFG